ncbi:phosphoadenosine phosphosulfate reductase domain-containing protein [Candidatus Methanarcanum hacksteinii]|uniref:phosphoadenosine phosphosulfate reductase domain-containing protein n=1 Tax=Candidatus Methanarcanum hacksteinii TaxID=2911857 RepID=UPI0037DDB5EE
MYSYIWDEETGGYLLTPSNNSYVAFEIRPVYSEELELSGLSKRFIFDHEETRPLMWAQKNMYLVNGVKVAQLNNTQFGKELCIEFFFEGSMELKPVDIDRMVAKNSAIMNIIIADTKRRTKELYDKDIHRCDAAYIAFSGGKDSVVLLDICNHVLPASVPVVFSDTDMELPDTYEVWSHIQEHYPNREFIRSRSETPALTNWAVFGPPSRGIRWCCSVHKSTPALITLKKKLFKESTKIMAFVGVRGEESYLRSFYEDSSDGVKNASQMNRMPLIDWGAHEIWLYLFEHDLIVNKAYRKGLPRVGCAMCPESSRRYEWFVNQAYPGLLDPYNRIIIETSSKSFKDKDDEDEYLAGLGWQARKSGSILKDPLSNPFERREGNVSIFQVQGCSKSMFFEWIKTIGDIVTDDGLMFIRLPDIRKSLIQIEYDSISDNYVTIKIYYNSKEEQKELFLLMRSVIRKSLSCVLCRTCEANCLFGAISFDKKTLKINETKCTRCHKCHDIDNNCWRFRSMYKPDSEMLKMRSIDSYARFGLREKEPFTWISFLLEMGRDFFPWNDFHPLGKKMVPSASKWFQQSLLVSEKTREPLPQLELFRKYGGTSRIGWEFIWMALSNNSMLIKWLVTSTELNIEYSMDRLGEMLKETDSTLSSSTIDNGLAALKDMITKSPISDEDPFVVPTTKGKNSVIGVTRKSSVVEPITILYGLYLISEISGRNSFTVRDLMNADIDSKYVSPIVAFGLSAEDFKRICEGLRTKYPDYISTTFTHGNDGVEVHSEKYNIYDIVALAMGE